MSPQLSELALPAALVLVFVLAAAAAALGWGRHRRKRAAERSAAVAAATPAASTAQTAPAVRPPLPEAGPVIAKLYALAFDDAPLNDPDIRKAHSEVVRGTMLALQDIENRPEYSPRRPELLPRLMRELDNDENSLRSLSQLVGRDPTLAGNVLRTVNSPLYRSTNEPIESIERAVAMVGTTGLRSMVAAALLQPELTGGKGAFSRFPDIVWDHSLHSALAAASYAVLVADTDPFAAELLGMLMGLGSIIIVRVVRDEYALRPQLVPAASVATAVLDSWTSPTARHISRSWELSDRMSLALHEQLLDKSARHLSPLGRSLRFGRVAGAAALLVRANRMDPDEGRALLGDPADEQLESIWRKLIRDRR